MTTCKFVHLATGGYFRSCKKDGGHAIRLAVRENMLHTHFTTVVI